eukprot:jgi/Mesvir1/19740/Mv01667-RA.1
MSVQGTISHPGNRERYLASKRAELDKDVGGGKLRGTLEDRYIRATRYTLSLRQCGLPHYLLVSYLFWEAPEEARNFLPWVYIALDEDGTTGVFAARPFVDGSYVGETGGDLWGPDDEILNGWVFPSVRDLAGGLSMARLSRNPNTWLSWQGHAITSRPVQLGGELFLGLDLKGSNATTQSVVAELDKFEPQGLEFGANPHLYSRLVAAGFTALKVSRTHAREWTWREPAADAAVLVPRVSGWDAAVRVVLEAAGLTEEEAAGQEVEVEVEVCDGKPSPLPTTPVPGLLATTETLYTHELSASDDLVTRQRRFDWGRVDLAVTSRDDDEGDRDEFVPRPVATSLCFSFLASIPITRKKATLDSTRPSKRTPWGRTSASPRRASFMHLWKSSSLMFLQALRAAAKNSATLWTTLFCPGFGGSFLSLDVAVSSKAWHVRFLFSRSLAMADMAAGVVVSAEEAAKKRKAEESRARNSCSSTKLCANHKSGCMSDRGMLMNAKSVLDGGDECLVVHRCVGFVHHKMENENEEPCVVYLESKCEEAGNGDSRNCFWCGDLVDVVNMDSSFGRLGLTSATFLCPNERCLYKCKGIDMFEEHIDRCDQGIVQCTNRAVVGGVDFGCSEWLDPTELHECEFDFRSSDPAKSAAAKMAFLEALARGNVLVKDAQAVLMSLLNV